MLSKELLSLELLLAPLSKLECLVTPVSTPYSLLTLLRLERKSSSRLEISSSHLGCSFPPPHFATTHMRVLMIYQ